MKFPTRSYSKKAFDYANAVVSGKIDACWQVKAACQRAIDDLSRSDIAYDPTRTNHVCAFMEALPHVAGPLSGQTIKLEPFQVFLFACLFGFVDGATGLRKYREAFILMPRGQGKSIIAAGIALYMTFCLDQGGAQGFSGASSLDQANAVFSPARDMVNMTPELQEALGLEVSARSIVQMETRSSFKSVIAKTKDGGIPWIAICDELHEAVSDTQLQAFRTGLGKRKGADPMLVIISTAGVNLAGVCRQEQLYFEGVLNKTIDDDSKFALIYTIDETDDWRDFAVWKKANPNYGVSVDEKYLKSEYNRALQSPSAQAMALTKYLNVWCNSAKGWLNQKDWLQAADPEITIPTDALCWIGVDLSTKTDLTAITMVARLGDGRYGIIPFLFLPTGALDRSRNKKAYADWIARGAISTSEGSASDHEAVEDQIRELARTYNVQGVLFDPWQSASMSQRLAADGLPVLEFAQRASNFSPVMTDFEADLLNGRIVHDDNPVLNWMAANVSFLVRGAMMSPTKPTGQDHLKIDGVITTLMAYAMAREDEVEQLPLLDIFVLD